MSISRLFERVDPLTKDIMREAHQLRHEIVGLKSAVQERDRLIKKLKAELHNTKHRKSGLYHFRDTEVRDMSRGIQRLEHGDWDGLRLLVSVMDDINADWRNF